MEQENRLLRLPEVLERVPIEEFSQTFDYGLKDITKLDDFNQVVDWENSSFNQATNQ
ncbi:hypothetical protein [Prochlorococcus marinus]|uniref:hypothetical protein n=1 Tax=Prochlorococcus marinus TaxID=1219 RepID=UPI0022B3B417|nr:hypothetical protein [Prochlorococcus marinus]